MNGAIARLDAYADTLQTIVIVGPTGTGKTALAEIAHWRSKRSGDFVEVSGPELASELGEDILFGHLAGAFTSAIGKRLGAIQLAAGGTLLLDDFGRASERTQGALLRVIGSRRYRAAGADRDSRMDCRLIVCMHEHPDMLISEGLLMPDLRYRFGACTIIVPALAERREEIPALVNVFLARAAATTGVEGPTNISTAAMDLLVEAEWPGNVRQLRGVVEAAYVHARHNTVIEPQDVPVDASPLRFVPRGGKYRNDRVIEAALAATGNRVSEAAALLGVHRNTICDYRRRSRPRLHSSPSEPCADAQDVAPPARAYNTSRTPQSN